MSYHRRVAIEIEIDRDQCMGSGNCVFEAVGAFDLDHDGISFVIDAEGAPEANVIAAARKCPAHAISVRRDGEPVV